ncbi:hypothetical protein E2C01_073994 [Portunus trituberculatus]|uniref:Uncharacterized protein n=1 Tax=Portunus trituberculatus TaxID=210409 RepID=A0A5B7IB73_PORTR|nr:hypothetical protein [Portunus trituberculatus]
MAEEEAVSLSQKSYLFQVYVKDAEKRSTKEKKRAKSSGGSSEKRSSRPLRPLGPAGLSL